MLSGTLLFLRKKGFWPRLPTQLWKMRKGQDKARCYGRQVPERLLFSIKETWEGNLSTHAENSSGYRSIELIIV